MSRPDFLSPIVLVQQMPTWGAGQNQVDEYPPLGFRNPNKTPMILDQLRFWTSSATELSTTATMTLQKCDVKMSLGGIPLTNDWVPAPCVFPWFAGPLLSPGILSGSYQADQVLTWHLEKALLIMPGVQLNIAFRRANQTGIAMGIHGMTVVGRSMSESFGKPKTMQVPWICGVRAAEVTTVTRYVTTPNQLVNPHCESLNVTRFYGLDWPATLGDDNTVQMTLSTNKALIRDATPFRMLFPPERGMMQLNAQLEQHEHIVCELQAGNGNPSGLQNVCIGFHGYREIETPSGF